MASPDADVVARIVARGKERQTMDVVEMGVGVEQIEIARIPAPEQLGAQVAQPRTAVEDQQVLAAANLNARSVAAIPGGPQARAGDAAAYPPEPKHEIRLRQRQKPPPFARRCH